MFEFLIKKLKAHPRKIVFTEGTDPRILEASARLLSGTFLTPVLVGNLDEIQAAARERMDSMTFIRDLSEIPGATDIYKICGNDLDCNLVIRMKQAFGDYPDLAAASSFPNNIELTNTAAQKGSALKTYAAAKGISLEDVMVLGDSDNDISMFTPEFGWTVAMANSMDCIRERAKYITKSNAEDGVAWAIRKYVFGEDLSSPINRD